MEGPYLCGITFYKSDLKAVLMPHNNVMVSTVSVGDWKISHLLVDERSALSMLYLNYYKEMAFKYDLIMKDVDKVAGLNRSTSRIYG